MTAPARRAVSAAAMLAAMALASACAATPRGTIGIGVSKVGLTLAFADNALSDGPVTPQKIVQLIPAPPGIPATAQGLSQYAVPPAATASTPPVPTTTTPPSACPAAPRGAAKPAPAPLGLGAPPREGYYRIVNTGTVAVTADGVTLRFPYPALTTMRITDVAQSTTLPLEPQATAVTTFTAITTLTPTDVVTEKFQYTPSELDLVSRSEKNGATVTADTFNPAVKIYEAQGTGATWDAVGTDAANDRVLNFNGDITGQPVVDACGALLSTYAVTSTSSLFDAHSGSVSGTTTGHKDVQDIATGVGGLIAYQELHRTETETVNNAPVTIVTDVKSTLDGHAPSATPPATSSG